MKKIFFILVFSMFLSGSFAQTRVVNRILFPVKRDLVFMRNDIIPAPAFARGVEINFATGGAQDPLLFFNDQPLLQPGKPLKMIRYISTVISFSDVLEGSVNSIKPGIVNTYDDQVSELFKDAPSLVKLTCIIRL